MRLFRQQSGSARCARRPPWIAAAAVGTALAGLAAGCSRPQAAPPDQAAQAAAPEAPAVRVERPEKKDVRRLIERPGYNIEAYERTPLFAKVAGYVSKWNRDIGDPVHKDDVLAELYVPEMEVELRQKAAAVRQASSEIKQAEAAVLRWQADVRHAESQYQRLARVGRSGVLAEENVEENRLAFETAQAAVAKAQADVEVAKARLEVAKADRDRVQTLLQYTKILAPFDGLVTRRDVNTGDFVQPAAAGKGDALFVVERIKPVRVFVNVQELEAAWVHDGDVALVRAQGLQGQQFEGTVARTSKSLNPQNRTLRTEVDLLNTEGRLLPGMFVSVTIVAEHKNVWALPAAAVAVQGERAFCFRVEGGRAVRTPIKLGLRGADLVEVLKKQTSAASPGEERRWEDITGQEEVAVAEAGSLSEGQAVRPSSADR
jgi:RND family efflux transporter MFP subunit